MERKLVTIRQISAIKPIEGADAIELAIVDGWQCVVRKDAFKAGHYAFYCEIDSFLPTEREEFAFLKSSSGKKTVYKDIEGHRLRTIRLRKQLSQGLLLPLPHDFIWQPTENRDYAEYFGVIKWDAPIPAELAGTVRSTFPTHIIPKTDQERCISGDTLIETEIIGMVPIEYLYDIGFKGNVKSFNHETLCEEFKELLGFVVNHETKEDWYQITLENGASMKITHNHKVFVKNIGCYREAKHLKVGDDLLYK